MKRRIIYFILLVVSLMTFQQVASALDYLWLTNQELTVYGERMRFNTGDTLDGPIRANSQIAIMGSPVFLDHVSTCAEDFEHGPGYAPQFLGPPPVFHASVAMFPHDLDMLRSSANNQGYLFSPPAHHLSLLKFFGDSVVIYTAHTGVPFDSTDRQTLTITHSPTILYFECPIRVMGLVAGRVVVGSTHDINIEDDIRYVDSDSSTGYTPSDSPNYLALASAGNIKISNTIANGRENSAGLGRAQTDLSLTSVVVTAALYALGGSFTFENQNDPDSGYDYGSTDERGTLALYGGVMQMRRGYLHRSNRGGTGYLRHIHFDHRLRWWNDFVASTNSFVRPDTLDFGDIPIGVISQDTVTVLAGSSSTLGGVQASQPFHAQRIEPFTGMYFRIPVSITPSQPIRFQGTLTVSTEYHVYQVILRAHGIPPHSPELSANDIGSGAALPAKTTLNASPNPFNLSTELRYTLTEAGPVKLIIYDIIGREVRRFEMTDAVTGEHSLRLTADGMASGVYFAQLVTPSKIVTQKILLLK